MKAEPTPFSFKAVDLFVGELFKLSHIKGMRERISCRNRRYGFGTMFALFIKFLVNKAIDNGERIFLTRDGRSVLEVAYNPRPYRMLLMMMTELDYFIVGNGGYAVRLKTPRRSFWGILTRKDNEHLIECVNNKINYNKGTGLYFHDYIPEFLKLYFPLFTQSELLDILKLGVQRMLTVIKNNPVEIRSGSDLFCILFGVKLFTPKSAISECNLMYAYKYYIFDYWNKKEMSDHVMYFALRDSDNEKFIETGLFPYYTLTYKSINALLKLKDSHIWKVTELGKCKVCDTYVNTSKDHLLTYLGKYFKDGTSK